MNPYTRKNGLRSGVGGCLTALLLAALLVCPAGAQATDIYRGPLGTLATAKPNVVMGLDDNIYLDSEIMLNTYRGFFWWNTSAVTASGTVGTGWDSNGVPIFDTNQDAESRLHDPYNVNVTAGDYYYLFSTGCGPALQRVCDTSYSVNTLPPTIQFASLRSKDYNPLYYDPGVTYQPWANGTVNGVSMVFPNSVGTAARYHPLYSDSIDLTATVLPDSIHADPASFNNFNRYYMHRGMTAPALSQTYDAIYNRYSEWVGTGEPRILWDASWAAITYYPATYWIKQSCWVDDVSCTKAPDGPTLKRYEIKPGNSFPGGRSYAVELQNFANWFTYHRKQKFMLAAAMGRVLPGLSGLRVGVVNMSSMNPPTMVDLDSSDPQSNGQVVLGQFYQVGPRMSSYSQGLQYYIGNQFQTNTNLVQSGCQRNAALFLTDAYGGYSYLAPPAYAASTWGSGAPYQTTYANTMADFALSYYSNNLRPDLAAGKVPTVVPTAANPGADNNPNPHMNTYAVTLGVQGKQWSGSNNAYASSPAWTNPLSQSPTAIDDLWHAAVNGRGTMFTAHNATETATGVQNALNHIRQLAGPQTGGGVASSTGGVAFSTVNLKTGNALAYVGTYRLQDGSGDVSAYAVDTTTGALASTATWSAAAQLQARDYTTRAMASFNGTRGVAFTTANVGRLVATGAVIGWGPELVDYLRGGRTLEASPWFRIRIGHMGAVVNAEPVSLPGEGVLFATTNDGLVHALDQSSGQELWAYVPGFVLADAGLSILKTWSFRTLLDATPTLGKVNDRYLLVGGRGSAGAGFYALDVSNPKGSTGSATDSPSDANVAARVLWEFPSASTSADVVKTVGVSLGKPVIANSHKYGPVVLVSSGYNSTADGRGRVFVLNALTGALLKTFVTTTGTLGTGDAGLTQLAGFTEADGTVNYLYGGDLLGNVWRFGLEDGSILRLATLADSAGNAQPVTAIPELATVNRRRMVFVGTGRLLAQSDFGDTKVQSFYALWDKSVAIANPRASLAPRSIAVNAGNRTVSGSAIDWGTQQGWYVDLPAGERANTDPSIAYGVLAFSTNNPTGATCSVSSALYLANLATGLQLADSAFPAGQAVYGLQLGNTLTGRVSISRLPSGAIEVVTHQSDNSSAGRLLNPSANAKPVKAAWKAVLR